MTQVGKSISLQWTVRETVGNVFPHGEQRDWQRGCRCKECVNADRDYQRAHRAKNRPGPAPVVVPECLWSCNLCGKCLDRESVSSWRTFWWQGHARYACRACELRARNRIEREIENRRHNRLVKR
jgi:hypothetical protein